MGFRHPSVTSLVHHPSILQKNLSLWTPSYFSDLVLTLSSSSSTLGQSTMSLPTPLPLPSFEAFSNPVFLTVPTRYPTKPTRPLRTCRGPLIYLLPPGDIRSSPTSSLFSFLSSLLPLSSFPPHSSPPFLLSPLLFFLPFPLPLLIPLFLLLLPSPPPISSPFSLFRLLLLLSLFVPLDLRKNPLP